MGYKADDDDLSSIPLKQNSCPDYYYYFKKNYSSVILIGLSTLIRLLSINFLSNCGNNKIIVIFHIICMSCI